MKRRLLSNLANTTIILVMLVFVVLSCGDANNKNNSNRFKTAIGGSVFPSNEVCNYQKGTVLDKYGGLTKKWEKVTAYEPGDPNALYFCEPTDKSVKITDSPNDLETSLEYEAWGGNPQGAYIIKLEYWARSNTIIDFNVEQALRIKIFIPYCNDITKKALKTSLSKSMIEKLTNLKEIGYPTGVKAKPFCEKIGQGFVCITNNISQSDNLVDFKIFASEEGYQSFLSGDS